MIDRVPGPPTPPAGVPALPARPIHIGPCAVLETAAETPVTSSDREPNDRYFAPDTRGDGRITVRTARVALLAGTLWWVASATAGYHAVADASDEAIQWPVTGTVTETMDTSRYTYVRVDTGENQLWAAGPGTAVGVGDTVRLSDGFPIANFRSNTLNRTFDILYLVSAIRVER
jgi:hypothetical protein